MFESSEQIKEYIDKQYADFLSSLNSKKDIQQIQENFKKCTHYVLIKCYNQLGYQLNWNKPVEFDFIEYCLNKERDLLKESAQKKYILDNKNRFLNQYLDNVEDTLLMQLIRKVIFTQIITKENTLSTLLAILKKILQNTMNYGLNLFLKDSSGNTLLHLLLWYTLTLKESSNISEEFEKLAVNLLQSLENSEEAVHLIATRNKDNADLLDLCNPKDLVGMRNPERANSLKKYMQGIQEKHNQKLLISKWQTTMELAKQTLEDMQEGKGNRYICYSLYRKEKVQMLLDAYNYFSYRSNFSDYLTTEKCDITIVVLLRFFAVPRNSFSIFSSVASAEQFSTGLAAQNIAIPKTLDVPQEEIDKIDKAYKSNAQNAHKTLTEFLDKICKKDLEKNPLENTQNLTK